MKDTDIVAYENFVYEKQKILKKLDGMKSDKQMTYDSKYIPQTYDDSAAEVDAVFDKNDDFDSIESDSSEINEFDGSTTEVLTKVPNEEYLQYITDTDVLEYLKGVLWVIQMYIDGKCPDLSYTYVGRPPITPFAILDYIGRLSGTNKTFSKKVRLIIMRYLLLLFFLISCQSNMNYSNIFPGESPRTPFFRDRVLAGEMGPVHEVRCQASDNEQP
jgi:hypothetical protein